jgi:hypothetical protein
MDIDPNIQDPDQFGGSTVQAVLLHIQYSPPGLPFSVCTDIIPGLLEMREVGQGVRIWFRMAWGIPTIGFSEWLHYRIFGPGMSGFQKKC